MNDELEFSESVLPPEPDAPTTPEARPIFEVQDLKRRFPVVGGGHLDVLNGVSFSVQAGEIVAIVGQSGAGKSTLLHLLGLLDTPNGGEIRFDGANVAYYSDRQRATIRNREIGFVFQMYHLLQELNALENVYLPSLIRHGIFRWGGKKKAARERARFLLDAVGLSARHAHRPNQLSGGECQRVALARALMHRPRIVLCDEPTGNLDLGTKEGIHDLIVEMNQRENQAFVLVTHDPSLTRLAHRVLEITTAGQIEVRSAF